MKITFQNYMKAYISSWGNSLAVRIPKAFARHIGITDGSEVEISIEDQSITLKKSSKKLDVLLDKITPENIHEEINFGQKVGKEIW